ncbi:MAG: methyltransferase [Anaerolineae bacterium]|nr:methyltransferase [Anaerolineae bacterium]
MKDQKMNLDHIAEKIEAGQITTEEALDLITALTGESDGDQIIDKIKQFLIKKISAISGSQNRSTQKNKNLMDLGIDSAQIISLTREIEAEVGIELYPTLFFEYPNVDVLATFLGQDYGEAFARVLEIDSERSPADQPISQNTTVSAHPLNPPVDGMPARSYANGTTRTIPFATPAETAIQPKAKLANTASVDRSEDIAVIGLSGRYPQAEDVREFWGNLKQGRDCITEIPHDRWDHALYYDADQHKPDKSYSKWGGFISDVDKFDPLFFNISPREAIRIDPQERLFLETVWATLEDAGYTRQTLHDQLQSQVGVFVGVMWGEYQLYGQTTLSLSSSYASIANRVSYFFDLQGPSLAVDTMCSSSLTSLHLACESIKRGECLAALVGGVNISIHPNKYLQLSQGKFASSDGRCRSFGEGGDGYVPGEGVGAVLLKPLSRAEADGDHIYGVIKGSSINHGGKTSGYTVPNLATQAQVIRTALQKSGLAPGTITYIEAHGTGTALGDPIEIQGLSRVFGHEEDEEKEGPPYAIGSVKSNIGHLEAAAGIAGLTKVLLQMKHQQLVPSLHADTLNPYIDFSGTSFRVQRTLAVWPRPIIEIDGERKEYPRRAGISSFGAGGANAHVVVEEYHPSGSRSRGQQSKEGANLIVLSAKNEARLKAYAQKMLDFLAMDPPDSLAELAYTLQVGREAMEHRLALVVADIAALRKKLEAFIAGKVADEDCYQESVTGPDLGKLAELWVKGAAIDWPLLYKSPPPQRISLPTYPFERKRYWFDMHQGQQMEPSQQREPIFSRNSASLASTTKITLKSLDAPGADQIDLAQPTHKIDLKVVKDTSRPLAEEPSGGRPDNQSEVADFAELGRPDPQQQAKIKRIIKETLAAVLYIDIHDFDDNTPFLDLGLDSVTAVELSKHIHQEIGIKLNVTRLYDNPTIEKLSAHLNSQVVTPAEAHEPEHGPQPQRIVSKVSNKGENLPSFEARQESRALPERERRGDDNKSTAASMEPFSISVSHSNQSAPNDEIAVIGMAGRFPGANDVDEFWHNIAAGRDCIQEVPPERWDIAQYFDPDPQTFGKTYSKWLGALADIDKFDPLFFQISPREAELMDPQQRLFLEEAWKAIEDAGYVRQTLAQGKCGVFVGTVAGDYARLAENNSDLGAYSLMGSSPSILTARISYLLNLKGPSIAIDTACSSSLVAIHEGCQSLISGQNDMVLAGGVYIGTTPGMHIMTSQAGMLSPDGRCKTFDNRANGFVLGEGVGVIVLKRLQDAIRDGDHIYGVIKSSRLNQDGATNGITAPSVSAQKALALEVYGQSGLDPAGIQLVEAHGTGTKLGDPIEMAALTEAFQAYTLKQGYCAIGSVKTNIGHTLTAAGVAGVIKVLLALKHKKLPPSLHFDVPNEHIDFAESPFYVNTDLKAWPSESGPRRAAVSSLGYSGTNAHLVIEEAPVLRACPEQSRRDEGKEFYSSSIDPEPYLFVLSARNEERLKEYIQKLLVYLEQASSSVPAKQTIGRMEPFLAIQQMVQAMVSEILGVDSTDIEIEQPFAGHGLDAVQLSRMKMMAEERYHCELPITLFSAQSSVADVAQHLTGLKPKSESNRQAPPPAELSLASLVYTLQVGREAMEARLAFVVTRIEELIERLRQIEQNASPFEPLYRGNTRATPLQSNLLIEGEAGRAFIEIIIKNKELHKLAQLWVSGVDVNWRLLYPHSLPHRMSLPTYPFARERHWVSEVKDEGVKQPETVQGIASLSSALSPDEQALKHELDGFEALESLAQLSLLQVFQRMGVFQKAGEHYHRQDLIQQLNFLPKYRRLFDAFMSLLEQSGYINFIKTKIQTTARLGQPEIQQALQTVLQRQEGFQEDYPTLRLYLTLLQTCTQSLPDIVQGQIPATDILFPNGSPTLMEGLYKGTAVSDYFNRLVALSVKRDIEQRQPPLPAGQKINIVEIGAGTGSTTGFVLEAIKLYGDSLEYHYTDISQGFTNYGQTRFGVRYPWLKFGLLDIETKPERQGYDLGQADLIVGANVVHATKNIQHSLQNLKALLKPGGLLVLNEVTLFSTFSCLTAGLLDGWWLFEDEERRIKHTPLLSFGQWQRLLEEVGFTDINIFDLSPLDNHKQAQGVIVARREGDDASKARGLLSSKPVHKPTPKTEIEDNSRPAGAAESYIEQKVFEQVMVSTGVAVDRLDPNRALAEYGIDSIMGIKLINGINRALGIRLQTETLFNYPTIHALTRHIDQEYGASITPDISPTPFSREPNKAALAHIPVETRLEIHKDKKDKSNLASNCLVPIRSTGTRPPFFCVHPWAGMVYPYYELAAEMGPDQPFYGFQAVGLYQQPHTSIEEMAGHYLTALRQVQPGPPYLLGGWSMGGLIAFEMAQQLQQAGEAVASLALFDVPAPIDTQNMGRAAFGKFLVTEAGPYVWPYVYDYFQLKASFHQNFTNGSSDPTDETSSGRPVNGWRLSQTMAKEVFSLASTRSTARRIFNILRVGLQAMANYEPQPYLGQVTLFRVQRSLGPDDPSQTLGWNKLAEQGVVVHSVPGHHLNLMKKPQVQVLAGQLRTCLDQIQIA